MKIILSLALLLPINVAFAKSLTCAGFEPNWSLEISPHLEPETIRFTSPVQSTPITIKAAAAQPFAGTSSTAYQHAYISQNPSGEKFHIIITKKQCLLGNEENKKLAKPYEVMLFTGSDNYLGCCTL